MSLRTHTRPALAFLLTAWIGLALIPPAAAAQTGPNLDTVLAHIEKRYAVAGFTAHFFETSSLKALKITDTAKGTMTVKRPGKMRWSYETPEPQLIVTDGKELWIYRPNDNQVMEGRAPTLFGNGKGAGFLSNMQELRRQFTVTLEPPNRPGTYLLNLVPHTPTLDIHRIRVTVEAGTYTVVEIVTVNAYGDKTSIHLTDIRFSNAIGDSLFTFSPPPGVQVMQLGQQ